MNKLFSKLYGILKCLNLIKVNAYVMYAKFQDHRATHGPTLNDWKLLCCCTCNHPHLERKLYRHTIKWRYLLYVCIQWAVLKDLVVLDYLWKPLRQEEHFNNLAVAKSINECQNLFWVPFRLPTSRLSLTAWLHENPNFRRCLHFYCLPPLAEAVDNRPRFTS